MQNFVTNTANWRLLLICLLLLTSCSQKRGNDSETAVNTSANERFEITGDTATSQTVRLKANGFERELLVWKPIQNSSFAYYCFDKSKSYRDTVIYPPLPTVTLSDEVKYLDTLWKELERKNGNKLDLERAYVGYPTKYTDVLNKWIHFLQNSPDWKRYSQEKNRDVYPDKLIEESMHQSRVYKSFDSLLRYHGYSIVDYHMGEKLQFLTKDFLKKGGYDTTLIVPNPTGLTMLIEPL